jgi:dipeptidyl aminopeptidase/acylaminoacyl peptidase
MRVKTTITCFAAGMVLVVLFAKDLRAADTHPMTVDDIIYNESATGFDISPDGRWVVWVKVTPDKEKTDFKQNVFLSSTDDTITIPITRTTRSDRSPLFSPDGAKIAFLSTPEKASTQIYLYDIRGGEPEKLTDVAPGVDRFEWRDAKTILFTAREDSTLRERTLKKAKDSTIIVADQEHYPPVRLFEISIEKKDITRLTTNTGAVTEFAVSPDGRWVATNENIDVNYAYDYKNPPRQFLLDLSAGTRREILPAPHVAPYDFAWDGESKGFYCRRPTASDSTDTYVSIDELYYFDVETGSLRKVATGWENGLGHAYAVVRGGIVAAVAGGVRDPIIYLETSGHRVEKKQTLRTKNDQSIRLLAAERDGNRLVYLRTGASRVPEIMTAVIGRSGLVNEKELVRLNEDMRKRSLARTEIVRWRGALDEEVEGVLYYPLGYEEGKRYPLIASIHGGPAGADMDFFSANWGDYPHLLASKGAFVFNVNYHGSGNYGLRWVESIKGHYYDYEVPDIMTGIDTLIGRGLVDPDRLGIMGWSNGAILAIEACLRSGRFKVLCAGAGDVNWTSDYGNCAFGAAFDNAYLGGPPWDKPDTYIEKSPLFRMREMRTPTLIMFGTRDTSVPTEQGWQQFRAIQQIGAAPVRFLLFPDEEHGLRKLAHRKRKVEEELVWFDKYLFETHRPANEALDTLSPLAMALEKTKISRDGDRYGRIVGGVLVPEVVSFNGIEVGRFEVTRAQFKEFRSAYDVPPSTENYPANGVSYEDARAYCLWLSEKTGHRFRLPTVDEMNKLVDAAKSNTENENNLDRWVAYAPTPEERELVEAKVGELEKTRLLIEEVGSFRPVDPRSGGSMAGGASAVESGTPKKADDARAAGDTDVPIYDLGGNVAEWATDKEGGRVMGLSAVSVRNPATPYGPPRPAYVGFRVRVE